MTPMQERFVEALLSDDREIRHCATRAAQRAGYKWPDKQGPRLMTFPQVAAAIEAGFERMMRRGDLG